jgi:hypothetical protein
MFPDEFDGILAGAPAIYWDKYVIAEQWPQVVMKEENVFPSQCELNAISQAAIAECDAIDGVRDGVITDPDLCKCDPFILGCLRIKCYANEVAITRGVASVVRKNWNGLKLSSGHALWYGMNAGAPQHSLANTTAFHDGRRGNLFFINDGWIRYFIKAKPGSIPPPSDTRSSRRSLLNRWLRTKIHWTC